MTGAGLARHESPRLQIDQGIIKVQVVTWQNIETITHADSLHFKQSRACPVSEAPVVTHVNLM